jgi:hypothetical protein
VGLSPFLISGKPSNKKYITHTLQLTFFLSRHAYIYYRAAGYNFMKKWFYFQVNFEDEYKYYFPVTKYKN